MKISVWPMIIVGGLLIMFLAIMIPLRAVGAEDDGSTSLAQLIPNFDKIYQQALVSPHQEVAKKITDPEIADYYNRLLHKVGFDVPLEPVAPYNPIPSPTPVP